MKVTQHAEYVILYHLQHCLLYNVNVVHSEHYITINITIG